MDISEFSLSPSKGPGLIRKARKRVRGPDGEPYDVDVCKHKRTRPGYKGILEPDVDVCKHQRRSPICH